MRLPVRWPHLRARWATAGRTPRTILHGLAALAVAAAFVRAAAPAGAQGPGIVVLAQNVESSFPDRMTFTLRARSDAGDIVSADLYYQVGWERADRLGRAQAFTPAPEVALTHVWDTRGETVPPFVEITYSWHLADRAGNVLVTPPQRVEYIDRTHAWQSRGNERVIAYWHGWPDEFGQALFQAAAEGYDHVASITGVVTDRPARIVIYRSQRDFCSFYAPNSCESWIGGQTFPGITVQWGTDRDWLVYDVVPHELAHVFYAEVFRDTWVAVPTWFNEGIAVYNERTDHRRELEMVEAAAASGDLIPLRLMGTQASGLAHDSIHLWYAQAYTLVAFIADVYGEAALGEVIHTLAGNTPMEQVLQQVLGLDLMAFEVGWRAWLGYPVDSLPTPVSLAPMAVTPFGLPSARGTAAPTAAARPALTATATPTSEPSGSPSPPSCLTSSGVLLVGVLAVGGVQLRRRRQPDRRSSR